MHPSDELIGHRIVFALAQSPRTNAQGIRLAVLAPLMDLDSGNTLSGTSVNFPGDGYVFWWNVPAGDLILGQFIVGKLWKSQKYGEPNSSWYQISGAEGQPQAGEVIEYFKISLEKNHNLRSLVNGRRPVDFGRMPFSPFYVWVDAHLIGPFQSNHLEHLNSETAICCVPVDRNGRVRLCGGDSLTAYVDEDRGYCEARLLTSPHPPSDSRSKIITRSYRLIQQVAFKSLCGESVEKVVLTDELAISKACNSVVGRSLGRAKSRELRDDLNALVKRLRTSEANAQDDLLPAMEEILLRNDLSENIVDEITEALLTTEQLKDAIDEKVRQRVVEETGNRASEIEDNARLQKKDLLSELENRQHQLNLLETELAETQIRAEARVAKAIEHEKRVEAVVLSANNRLRDGRNELLGELSLLGPMIHLFATDNRNAVTDDHYFDQAANGRCTSKRLRRIEGPEIGERDFVERRLMPMLIDRGCKVQFDHAKHFHAILVASRMTIVPHVGWATAYAEAMGGAADVHPVVVEPDWISFESTYRGELGRAWSAAHRDSSRLHLIVLDGIDRSPSHAWFQPWIHVIAGWREALPAPSGLNWPENIRIILTEDLSEASFPNPHDLSQWATRFESTSKDEFPDAAVAGHFPLSSWRIQQSLEEDFAFDGLLKEVEIDRNVPSAPARRRMIKRLREVYSRMGEDEDRFPSYVKWLLRTSIGSRETTKASR